jgi:hypothetical protein
MLAPPGKENAPPDAARDALASLLARGVCRALAERGFACLTEFPLGIRRRVDVAAIDGGGEIVIVEIKSGLEDFRADRKWRDYLGYCDRFFFAVPEDFPCAVLPADCGLLVADGYGAALRRAAPRLSLHPSRRRAQTLRFARAAALRLAQLDDPNRVAGRTARKVF